MSDLIDKKVLYNRFADLEAVALEQVKKHMHDEDLMEWRIWSTILAERTAYKHDVFDAPVVDAEPVVRCKDCEFSSTPEWDSDEVYCSKHNNWFKFNGYCHLGRKEDAKIN